MVKATYGRKLVWAYATRETRVRGDREERQQLASVLARVSAAWPCLPRHTGSTEGEGAACEFKL